MSTGWQQYVPEFMRDQEPQCIAMRDRLMIHRGADAVPEHVDAPRVAVGLRERPPFHLFRLDEALSPRTVQQQHVDREAVGTPVVVFRCGRRPPVGRPRDAERPAGPGHSPHVGQLLEGVRRRKRSSRDGASPRPRRRVGRGLISVVAVPVAAAAVGVMLFRGSGRLAGGTPPIRSIAVLPFQNLSGDPGQEYFGDGMTESLSARLAQIHSLAVTSRTSAMRFKDNPPPIPEIGRLLGVDAIVESSVQRSGTRVRIIAQLIRASTDTHLWAKEFNGSTSDLLELESNVANAIADEIRAEVTPTERQRLTKTPRRVAPDAQDAYLLGRYQEWRNDVASYKQAIGSFERAISIQPDYAEAYALLSIALRNYGIAVGRPDSDRIRNAAFKALELDPDLAVAHAAVVHSRTCCSA